MSFRTAVENAIRHDAPELDSDDLLSLWHEYLREEDYSDDLADLCANAMNGDEAFRKLVAIRYRFDHWCERRERNRR